MQRAPVLGRPVDFYSSVLTQRKRRPYSSPHDHLFLPPHEFYAKDMEPCHSQTEQPISAVCTNWIHSYNLYKRRAPVLCCMWTPEGRRLLTGNKGGEINMMSGFAFTTQHQFSAHVTDSVQHMVWIETEVVKPDTALMLTAGLSGHVYYWSSNMVCIKDVTAHDRGVRQISVSPPALKFATASDDGSVKLWDLTLAREDAQLSGHGNNVTCVDWHNQCNVLASGSFDKFVKLWDPRSGACISTLSHHHNVVQRVQWNANGYWLLSAGRDLVARLTDIRTMKELYTFQGHTKEVLCLDWHPIHTSLFASGGSEGTLYYWIVGHQGDQSASAPAAAAAASSGGGEDKKGAIVCRPVASVVAHTQSTGSRLDAINDARWHPLGHLIATVGNDINTRVWGRGKPGQQEDIQQPIMVMQRE